MTNPDHPDGSQYVTINLADIPMTLASGIHSLTVINTAGVTIDRFRKNWVIRFNLDTDDPEQDIRSHGIGDLTIADAEAAATRAEANAILEEAYFGPEGEGVGFTWDILPA